MPRFESSRIAICLVSGGMDSAVVLAEARQRGFDVRALSFDYGQRHRVELEAAGRVALAGGATEHHTVRVDLCGLGGSALTSELAVPKDRASAEIGRGVPVTYVPARNTVFLSIALGWAEILGARDLFVGVNAVDYSGYPDCRPEFLAAFEALARKATAVGSEEGARFTVHAPLMELGKADIVRRGRELGVDFALTHTCYDPVRAATASGHARFLACGRCDACSLRLAGFAAAGENDPVPYASSSDGPDSSALAGVLLGRSAIERAARLGALAMQAGFRWPDSSGALAKVREETVELVDAFKSGDRVELERELGDLFLAATQFANYCGLDPEAALTGATQRFEQRFRAMESELAGAARGASLDEWMAAWQRAKVQSR